nr:retrovirus-related Pol polyprotein from transposon TNT 1-94 [Tanacetum cinerariifolium]
MRENDKEEKVKHEMDEIETINIELEHSVAKLLLENERLHKEIKHLKKIYKDQFDSIKNTRALSKKHGLKSSSSTFRSQPIGNKKNDRISQTSSSNIKNKVEVQCRRVKSKSNKKNRIKDSICDANVKNTMLNANSELICVKYNQCMFDANHDVCFLDFVNDVNVRSKSKSVKKSQHHNIWKPTGKVFTEVGHKWKQTGRIFTIVGNSCPLTRITPNKIVHLKETTSNSVRTPKPEIKVYCRRPKQIKLVGLSNKAKIVESKIANNSEPNHLWRSNATDGPSSSSLVNDRQFCDADLEVAFRKNTCFIHNLEGVDLLSGSRDTNMYTISSDDMIKTSPICLLSKASKTKSWYGTNFRDFYENVVISHQTSVARTPQQNDVVERKNQTLMEAARTMLIFSKAPLFLWAEAINTACYTQNRSLIRLCYNKTPYELMHDKKPDLSFLHVFGSLCYLTNDSEDLGKLNVKADIGPGLHVVTPATSSLGLVTNLIPQQPCNPPKRDDWDRLFQPMFDEYFNPSPIAVSLVPLAATPRAIDIANSPLSTDAPSTSIL